MTSNPPTLKVAQFFCPTKFPFQIFILGQTFKKKKLQRKINFALISFRLRSVFFWEDSKKKKIYIFLFKICWNAFWLSREQNHSKNLFLLQNLKKICFRGSVPSSPPAGYQASLVTVSKKFQKLKIKINLKNWNLLSHMFDSEHCAYFGTKKYTNFRMRGARLWGPHVALSDSGTNIFLKILHFINKTQPISSCLAW